MLKRIWQLCNNINIWRIFDLYWFTLTSCDLNGELSNWLPYHIFLYLWFYFVIFNDSNVGTKGNFIVYTQKLLIYCVYIDFSIVFKHVVCLFLYFALMITFKTEMTNLLYDNECPFSFFIIGHFTLLSEPLLNPNLWK